MRATIAIFLDHPRCSIDGVNAILSILQPYYNIKIFTKHKLPDNWFDNIDIILVPGGLGDVNLFNKVMKHHITPIRDYIKNGGRYLGICMGAYWAGKDYLNLLKDRDCVQFMGRPGSKTFRPHPKDLEVTWKGEKEKIYWYDGCSIVGSGKFDAVATYNNGDIMAGFQGRVGLIGSHLEADKSWYDCHSWMKKSWNKSKEYNNNLLVDFTKDLMKR